MINWLRDRPRFCWSLVTWIICAAFVLSDFSPIGISMVASAIWITALRVDRRNRSVTSCSAICRSRARR